MDLREFKIQVLPLKGKLFRLAKRMLGDAEDAQDLVQEVFIKLWDQREKLDEYRNMEVMVMKITRNMCIDVLRKKRYQFGDVEEIAVHEEEKVNQSEIVSRIQNMIKILPEPQRTIIHLRDVENYEYDKIAEVVGMTENAIRVSLCRTRKAIKETLGKNQIYGF